MRLNISFTSNVRSFWPLSHWKRADENGPKSLFKNNKITSPHYLRVIGTRFVFIWGFDIDFGMLWSSSVVGLALVLVLSDGLLVNSEPTTAPAKGSLDAVYPGPWLSELFYQALANFTVRNVGSTVCQKQSRMYDMHLQNHTNWAVRSEYAITPTSDII